MMAEIPARLAPALGVAARLLRSGDTARALGAFNDLLKRAPGNPRCLHGRGLALSTLGLRGDALDDFRSACEADPDAWTSAASIADITPDEDERMAALDQAADALLRLCTRDASPYLVHAAAGALADAHRFNALLEFALEHTDRFAHPSRSLDWQAKAHYELGAFDEALHRQQDALLLTEPRRHPSPPPAGWPKAAAEAFNDIANCLQEFGLTAFAVAGTLLGFIRDGSPLQGDRDIDIGLFRQPDGGPDLAAIIRRHPKLCLPRRARPGDGYIGLTHCGVGVDIYRHDRKDGSVTCGVSERRGDLRWRFTDFDLEPREFAGRVVYVPKGAGRYLAETYGSEWRVPDRGFSSAISSPALDGTDIRVRSFYAAARARAALQSGDLAKAGALARQSPISLRLPAWVSDGNP